MAEGHVAHRAVALAWLCPSASRLVAFAEGRAASLTDDPASALLMLRFSRPSPTIDTISLQSFSQSGVLDAAAEFLDADAWIDPTLPVIAKLHGYSKMIAEQAESLAAVSNVVSPFAARITGLLAPLGWLACATVDPLLVEAVFNDPEFAADPSGTELQFLGLTNDAVIRRLADRWKLPAWCAQTIGTLRLPLNDAVRLGADRELSRVLRFAIQAVESQYGTLWLLGPSAVAHPLPMPLGEANELDSMHPGEVRLLKSLLGTAASARRQSGVQRVSQLEERIDSLQECLRQSRREFETELLEAKLDALAELAAGAGHEINNPLAVISGNAQLLRLRMDEPEDQKPLDIIIRQTNRIAELLQDLMQFARPAPPQSQHMSLHELLDSMQREYHSQALLKGIALQVTPVEAVLEGDTRQIRKALGNLVRNAIDAIPTGGSVLLFAELKTDTVDIIVEDSGPGPDAESVPHLFDPFFSGRSAGRGRGLGLSTAWQYTKQNGGTLRYEPVNGATRFVMTMPVRKTIHIFDRRSA